MSANMLQISHFILLLFAPIASCEAWAMSYRYLHMGGQNLAMGSLHSLSMSDGDTEEDWRDFRARLVAQEKATTTDPLPSTNNSIATDSSYMYEMGHVIEEGCVIVSRQEHDFCYGLRQQYFHKSIMLVLEHESTALTDGIILNRPTSQVLHNKDGNSWNIWYGGPVRGIDDDEESEGGLAFTCLHSLQNKVAKRLSNKIIKDIQWTTLDTAQFLVREKHAEPEDFQVYCGFACWSPGQLQRELERNNWYMTSVDSQTILQELLNRSAGDLAIDPFGMATWKTFADRIGRVASTSNTTTSATVERFDDCMLLEWIRANLLTDVIEKEVPLAPPTRPPGTILRASEPFLLDNQEFHKSLLLVLEDTLDATFGVLLNLPGPNSTTVGDESIPIRHGGKFGIQGQTEKPVTWYHNDETLREAQVGTPVGSSKLGIWSCTQQDAETAIDMGLACLDDFLVVQGASVFKKQNDDDSLRALAKFDVVPRAKVPQVWDALLSQEGVTRETLSEYMDVASSVWALLGGAKDVDLNTVAWKSWVAVFLLRDPKLRGS